MPGLNLQLFGGFEARTADGAALSFPTKKTRALLAYLAVHPGKSHSRNSLANLLWGDSADERARASLRQTLAYLRKALAPTGLDHLVTQDDRVSIDPATLQLDVATVERLTADGNPNGLEPVGELFRGDFLEGFDLLGEEFDDWLRAERGRLRGRVTAALGTLLAHHEARDQMAEGIRAATRLLEIDPLQEQAHRALMRLHLRQGERALALKQYEICRETLMREVDSEPDEETKRARDEARAAIPIDRSQEGEGQSETPSEGSNGVLELPVVAASHHPRSRRWMRPALLLATMAAMIVVAVAGVVAWLRPWSPDVEPASIERMAFRLPDQPSIAVLPFLNLSDDPEQNYLGDGITENIITELSRFSGLFVIARNSVFTYKGKPVKVQEVAEDLGVRYVLEGSIQRIDDEVRVNVQFVDAISGEHLWAERYDRELRDIFAVQDEITQKIVATLGAYEGRVTEMERAKRKKTTNLGAYELTLLAREARHRFNKEGNAKALELLERAVALDPQYARTHVEIAWGHFQDAVQNWSESREVSTRKAHDSAQRAIEIDESFAEGYWVSGDIYAWLLWEPEKSLAAYERALALNPNHADILANWGGWILPSVLGRAEEGIEVVKKAMRLNPFHADWYERGLATAYFVARRFEEAISTLQSVEHHTITSRLILVASYAHADRLEEGRIDAANVLKLNPDFSTATWLQSPYEPYRSLIRDGLRKAAMPQ